MYGFLHSCTLSMVTVIFEEGEKAAVLRYISKPCFKTTGCMFSPDDVCVSCEQFSFSLFVCVSCEQFSFSLFEDTPQNISPRLSALSHDCDICEQKMQSSLSPER